MAKKGITRRGFVKAANALGGASVVGVGGYAALQTLTPEAPPTLQETFLYLNPAEAKGPVWVVEQGLVGEEARRAFEREHDLPPRGTSDRRRYAVERLLKLAPPLEVLRK